MAVVGTDKKTASPAAEHPGKVLLTGPYAPPYGGVSVHLYRLSHWLRHYGIACEVRASNYKADASYPSFVHGPLKGFGWLKSCLPSSPGIVHRHSSGIPRWLGKGFKMLELTGRRLLLTMHSLRIEPERIDPGELKRLNENLNRMKAIICVGEHLRKRLEGIFPRLPSMFVIPSFLAPLPQEKDWNRLSAAGIRFLETHAPILATNASVLKLSGGTDLYGVDACIELAGRLAGVYPKIGLYVALPAVGDPAHFEKLCRRIRELGVADNVYFETRQVPFVPALTKTDVFLRLTASDGGASISLGEALALNVASIASDVCERYRGTMVCDRNDLESMAVRIESALDNRNGQQATPVDERLDTGRNIRKLIEVYNYALKNQVGTGDL